MCSAETKGRERDPCWRDVGTGEREEPCNGDDTVQGSTGDNEANKKEMQIWRLQAKNVGLERLRHRGGWGALGGSLIPLCPLESASSILEDTQTPQGELSLAQHTCLASLLPPSSFPAC